MRVACDIDLRKVYAVTDAGEVVCKAAPDVAPVLAWIRANPGALVLVEVASALDYTDSKAIAHQKRRWTIWNIAATQRIAAVCDPLVSPSHVWTRGHRLEVRHLAAKCRQTQKDLRECECMLWSHHHNPELWTPWPSFLATV